MIAASQPSSGAQHTCVMLGRPLTKRRRISRSASQPSLKGALVTAAHRCRQPGPAARGHKAAGLELGLTTAGLLCALSYVCCIACPLLSRESLVYHCLSRPVIVVNAVAGGEAFLFALQNQEGSLQARQSRRQQAGVAVLCARCTLLHDAYVHGDAWLMTAAQPNHG